MFVLGSSPSEGTHKTHWFQWVFLYIQHLAVVWLAGVLVRGPVDRLNVRSAIGASFRSANALIGEGSTMLSNVAVLRSLP